MEIAGWRVPPVAVQILLAGLVAPIILAVIRPFTNQVIAVVSKAGKWAWAAFRSVPNHLKLRRFVFGDKPLWAFRKPKTLHATNAPPTLTVMNFKGGVGKTTIAANLAAAFAARNGMRVLLVDLDYQGSLSDMLRPRTAAEDEMDLLTNWIRTERPAKSFQGWSVEAEGIPNARLVTAEYSLTETEDRQLLRWLIYETRDDVRSRLARKLNSPKWTLKDEFDLVIMDAPPRLSIASANALKATDFVLVPTKLQPLSSAPIAKMLRYLTTFKHRVKGHFRILGAVCNMTHSTSPTGAEQQYLQQIAEAFGGHPDAPRIFETCIPSLKDIGRPDGMYLGYNLPGQAGQRVRGLFDNLASEVGEAMNIVQTQSMAAE